MQIRTFLAILTSLVLVAFLAGLAYQNTQLLEQDFRLTPSRDVPLWTVLLGAFLAGVLSFVVGSLLRGSAGLLDRLRILQGRGAGRAVDEIYNRGIEAVLEGREERALHHFKVILARNPDHIMALLKGGAVLRSLGRAGEAVDLHKRAHRLQEKALEPLYELVKDYEALGEVGKGKVVLDRIIQLRPKRALSAFRSLRRYAIEEGDWDRAWQLQGRIEGMVENDPGKLAAERLHGIGIRYEMACAMAREGREREGLNALRKIARSAPAFVPAQMKLGEILAGQGLDEDAVKVWSSGFKQTSSPAFLARIEEQFLAAEDPEGAISVLQEAASTAQRDFLPRFLLAKLYLRLEMIDEALRELRALVDRAGRMDRSKGSPILHAHLGYAYERRHEFQAAAEAYRHVIHDQDHLVLSYRCQSCQRIYPRWVDRCEGCGEWNRVTLDFREDATLEDLKLSTGPVYSRTA